MKFTGKALSWALSLMIVLSGFLMSAPKVSAASDINGTDVSYVQSNPRRTVPDGKNITLDFSSGSFCAPKVLFDNGSVGIVNSLGQTSSHYAINGNYFTITGTVSDKSPIYFGNGVSVDIVLDGIDLTYTDKNTVGAWTVGNACTINFYIKGTNKIYMRGNRNALTVNGGSTLNFYSYNNSEDDTLEIIYDDDCAAIKSIGTVNFFDGKVMCIQDSEIDTDENQIILAGNRNKTGRTAIIPPFYNFSNGIDGGTVTVGGNGKLETQRIKASTVNVEGSGTLLVDNREYSATSAENTETALTATNLNISENAEVTVKGGATTSTLTLPSGETIKKVESSGIGIITTNLSITGGILNSNAMNSGAVISEDISVSGGRLNAVSNKESAVIGTKMTVSDGLVDIKSTGDTALALYDPDMLGDGNLTVEGGTLSVNNSSVCGIGADRIEITGGEITVNAPNAKGFIDYAEYIQSGGSVTVNAKSGIVTYASVVKHTISGGTLNITASESGICAEDLYLNISGGKVDVDVPSGATLETGSELGEITITGGLVELKGLVGLSTAFDDDTALIDKKIKITGGNVHIQSTEETVNGFVADKTDSGYQDMAEDVCVYNDNLTPVYPCVIKNLEKNKDVGTIIYGSTEIKSSYPVLTNDSGELYLWLTEPAQEINLSNINGIFTCSYFATDYTSLNQFRRDGETEFQLTLVPNEGSVFVNGETYTSAVNVTVNTDGGYELPIPVREGYTFLGWNTSRDGTGVMVTSDMLTASASNLTLYAIWQQSFALKYGDVDCNGEINMVDVTTMQKIIAKLITHESIGTASSENSDVNHDGRVTMEDVVLLQKYIAKLVVSLEPAEG